MLHSGSRGIGNAIGTYYITKARELIFSRGIGLPDKDLSWIPEENPLFSEYWDALSWAQNYARINREVMLRDVLHVLKRCLPPFTADRQIINCHHNYVSREQHFGETVYITRKGAISADTGEWGIIPGSMGTCSYIVQGKGNAESFHSCSHGAGRRMSRWAAKRHFTQEDLIQQTSGVECRKDLGVLDEIPGAYKDIDQVMAQQSDLVTVVHKLRQILCVKG